MRRQGPRRARRTAMLGAMASAVALAAAPSAFAAPTIATQPGLDLFDAGAYNMNEGETPTFNNDDPGGFHDVTANGKGADKLPLFQTNTFVGIGQDNVDGTEYLTAGTYTFVCTVHVPGMAAQLNVGPAGTPLPRPTTGLAITTGKLTKARKVRVSLTPNGSSPSGVVALKRGSKSLATKRLSSLQDGVKRIVTFKLGKSKAAPLLKKKKVALRVTATPRFGIPKSTTKTLRVKKKKTKK